MKQFTSMASVMSIFGVLFLLLGAVFVSDAYGMGLVEQVEQASIGSKPPVSLAVIENPELVSRVLESLLRSVVFSASMDVASIQSTQKRGLDLGISRGFSGSQAGKHLMGLSAASFANGPGRR